MLLQQAWLSARELDRMNRQTSPAFSTSHSTLDRKTWGKGESSCIACLELLHPRPNVVFFDTYNLHQPASHHWLHVGSTYAQQLCARRLTINCEGQKADECGGIIVNRTNPRVFLDNLEFRYSMSIWTIGLHDLHRLTSITVTTESLSALQSTLQKQKPMCLWHHSTLSTSSHK